MIPFADATVAKADGPLLGGPDRFRLAVFSPNMAGGTNLTAAPGPPVVTWEESTAIARAADRAGFDAIIPVARWRSPKRRAEPAANRSFEPFAWAAGLAAVTERIQVFATVHMATTHPLRAAKEAATVDHISGGRFGLNVVAGWNAAEFAMFGHDLLGHDDRYGMADEWMHVLDRAFAGEHPFDVEGRYFSGTDLVSEPRPVQHPGPVIMSAGASPAGRAFAARHADLNFVILPDRDAARSTVAAVKAEARRDGDRDLLVFGAGHILCRDTEAEARRDHRRVVDELGDREAAADAIASLMGGSQSASFDPAMAEAAIFGFFATPLVGTAEQVVEAIAGMADDGLDGLALSWVDYGEGIEQYASELAPLMAEAGLRPRG